MEGFYAGLRGIVEDLVPTEGVIKQLDARLKAADQEAHSMATDVTKRHVPESCPVCQLSVAARMLLMAIHDEAGPRTGKAIILLAMSRMGHYASRPGPAHGFVP